jgi:imidazolonepropionase-like amidohydrolase
MRFRATGQGDTSFIAQVARQLAGPAEAATAVKQVSGDVDYVSAVVETRGDADLQRMSAPVLRSIASTAHDLDLQVLAHVSSVADVKMALRTGADGLEHVPFDADIDSATLATLLERGIVVDPTLQSVEVWLGEARRDTAGARTARRNAGLLVEAGVPLVVGSDAPSPGTTFGFTFHEELRNLVEIGYTPGQAIAAGTIVAAAYLGVAERLGSIAPGKWADIIAVGGEPLASIESAADIYLVIADGQVLYNALGEVRRPGGVIALAKQHE